jgi:hypothetical protein
MIVVVKTNKSLGEVSLMMNKKLLNKILIWILCIAMVIPNIPIQGVSFAATTVTSVKYNTIHDKFNVESGFIEIRGTSLKGVDITIEDNTGRPYTPKNKSIDTDALVLIDLSRDETSKFNGKLYVGSLPLINLDLGSFPTVTNTNSKTINYGLGEDLVLEGTNLKAIWDASGYSGVKAEYIRNPQRQPMYDNNALNTDTKLTITDPKPPGGAGGFQDIVLSRATTTSGGATTVNVSYQYKKAFRLVNEVGLDKPEMFPNMGAHGDTVYFTADNFLDGKEYNAYFFKDLSGGDDYNSANRAKFVALSRDIDGTNEDKLTVKVPPRIISGDPKFDIGTYYVILVNEVVDGSGNVEVVAEQTIFKPKKLPSDPDVPDEYTIVESKFTPEIVNLNPSEGPDLGALTTIIGTNILEIDLPGLNVDKSITSFSTASANTELTAVYKNGTYGSTNEPVTVSRMFKVQIGKLATFNIGDYKTGPILKDHLPVKTGVITDALTNPVKDVQVEITTTIKEIASGKEYVFKQTAIKNDGFKFLPSTLEPEVTKILPATIQGIQSSGKYKFKEETLFAIEGKNFLVERVVEDSKVIVRMPTVLFKKEKGNIDFNKYQLGFFPANATTGAGSVIKYKYKESDPESTLTNGGVPIALDMVVLDDKNQVVDGTIGNDVGTKILIKIPNVSDQAPLGDIGIKQIQIINPTRGSSAFGGIGTFLDGLEIIETTNNPIIESIKPNIVTIAGGENVKITGANFQEGMKLYLDGSEIDTFTRKLDPLGTKYIVEFKAPPGRVGLTQIQVINPSGGMDVRDFSYVKSFNSDPVITNFTPTRGTPNTLVVVNGDNYLQPDTSVSNTDGVNGYRLIGTRAIIDGVDVNKYNKNSDGDIEFKEYSSPKSDYPLLTYSSDKAVWSSFKNNATIIKTAPSPVPDNEALFYIENDLKGNPMITNKDDETYFFTYEPISVSTGNYFAHVPKTDTTAEIKVPLTITKPVAGASPGVTTLSFVIGGKTISFKGTLDNNILRTALNEDGKEKIEMGDYVDSVVFKRQVSGKDAFFVLKKEINGDLVFTNNSDLRYLMTWDGSAFKANEKNKPKVDVSIIPEVTSAPVAPTKLRIDGNDYTMITPYIKSLSTGQITGDHTRIINAKQLTFDVPILTTGTGYKDLEIVNPDTRKDEKTGDDGFYYIKQSRSHPIISEISPVKGSIAGGYVVKITGSDFEDDMKVFIDSVEVPSADTFVGIDGSYVTVKVPKCIKDLQGDFGVDELSVPVVVLNEDGGSAFKNNGFTYVVPVSNPRIDKVILQDGSANGGETVQIIGYDFRYAEPYEDVGTPPGYNYPQDTFEDLYKNNKWDDLLSSTVDKGAVKDIPFVHPIFDYYKESPILPTVYFGENKAKVVEYAKNYIKVISPEHGAGSVPLYVVNNDQGVSNVVTYTYTSSVPKIDSISPNKGNRVGQEFKDIYGTDFFRSEMKGYADNKDDAIVTLDKLDANVRFGDIDNLEVKVGEVNDGLINSGRAEVKLSGDLTALYKADTNTIELQVTENGKVYKRSFNNYDDSVVYLPMEMLRHKTSVDPAPETYEYYYPSGYEVENKTIWNNKVYEYIKVFIKDRRLFVERGYAPSVSYISSKRLTVISPSYHTIDTVPVIVTNNDGGQGKIDFTYTNPDSKPKILEVNPYKLSLDKTIYEVQSSIQGGVQIEVIGLDFRKDVKAFIGTKKVEIVEETTRKIGDVTYDILILKVPQGTDADIDEKYPIVIENTDAGMANSTTLKDLLIRPGETTPKQFFFIYRKPLSGPKITEIKPIETSVFGGNKIEIIGSDFRTGAIVTIGTSGAVPITGGIVSDEGSKITVTTPQNMTVGDKTVQVVNADFGTASKENGLKIVSYPTVEDEVLVEDGSASAGYVNVEGGDKIRIKGTGFLPGAKVYFGGSRTTHSTKPTEGIVGLFKDDSYISLADAHEAQGVQVLDDKTLIITTPEITKEDDFKITVLNSDGGISEDNADIEFSEPVPSTPSSLKARVVDERYIQLYDYTSEGVEYYEIYYYLGSKTTSELGKNNRQAMKYLGTTTLQPYKVNRIPGFESRRPGDVLYFAVIAVNKYGVSKWSNYATLNYKQLEDVDELGPEDIDGDLGVPKGQDYTYDSDGTTSVINISEKSLSNQLTIDLRGKEDGQPQTRIINVPREMVQDNQSLIKVNYLDSKLQFTPVGLNTEEFRQLNFYERAYGRITTSTAGNSYNSMLKLSLPRGKKVATRIMTLEVQALNNEEAKTLNHFSAPMDIQLIYDDSYLSSEQEKSLQLYRFDQKLNRWELMPATLDSTNNHVTARTDKPGSFVVLYNR